jgi:hypothetical protein
MIILLAWGYRGLTWNNGSEIWTWRTKLWFSLLCVTLALSTLLETPTWGGVQYTFVEWTRGKPRWITQMEINRTDELLVMREQGEENGLCLCWCWRLRQWENFDSTAKLQGAIWERYWTVYSQVVWDVGKASESDDWSPVTLVKT